MLAVLHTVCSTDSWCGVGKVPPLAVHLGMGTNLAGTHRIGTSASCDHVLLVGVVHPVSVDLNLFLLP